MNYNVLKKYLDKPYDELMKTIHYVEIDNGGKITPDSLNPDNPFSFISENEIIMHATNGLDLIVDSEVFQRIIAKDENTKPSELIQW